MHHHGGLTLILFAVANLAIAAGYLAVPWLVLPYFPLTRLVKVSGAGMFLGCAGSHLWMTLVMPGDGPTMAVSAWWHAVQAGFTWAFILGFRHMLKAAHGRRRP